MDAAGGGRDEALVLAKKEPPDDHGADGAGRDARGRPPRVDIPREVSALSLPNTPLDAPTPHDARGRAPELKPVQTSSTPVARGTWPPPGPAAQQQQQLPLPISPAAPAPTPRCVRACVRACEQASVRACGPAGLRACGPAGLRAWAGACGAERRAFLSTHGAPSLVAASFSRTSARL